MPGSCSGFFFCVDGNAIASSCGNFYHFNSRLGMCDHPERAHCELAPPVLRSEVENDQEANEMCGRLNEVNYLFGKSKSCIQFYACHNKQAVKRVCPPQYHFNLKTKLCQDIQTAQCIYAKPLELPTATPTSIPLIKQNLKKRQLLGDICSGPKLYAMMTHPSDCGSYVYCINAKPQVMRCPKGLHFSVQRQRCEWPSIAQCDVMYKD